MASMKGMDARACWVMRLAVLHDERAPLDAQRSAKLGQHQGMRLTLAVFALRNCGFVLLQPVPAALQPFIP